MGKTLYPPGEGLEPVWIPAHRVKLSRQPVTPGNLTMDMFARTTVTLSISLALAEAKNYTYWAYVSNPLLLRPINWGEGSIPVYVNDSSWISDPEDKFLPIHKKEEGTPFKSTLGFDTWPVCKGADHSCLNLSVQAWLSENSFNRYHTKAQLHLLSGLSFGYQETDQINLTKLDRPLCESRPIWAN